MPVLAWNISGAQYPTVFVEHSRAEVRKTGLASHYARKALPWQVRSAITIAKMPYTALRPTPRLMAWRFMFGEMASTLALTLADVPGKLQLHFAGRRAPAGLVVPKIAAAIQAFIRGVLGPGKVPELLDQIAAYNKVKHPITGKEVFPSRIYRTAHTMYDLARMLGKDTVNKIDNILREKVFTTDTLDKLKNFIKTGAGSWQFGEVENKVKQVAGLVA